MLRARLPVVEPGLEQQRQRISPLLAPVLAMTLGVDTRNVSSSIYQSVKPFRQTYILSQSSPMEVRWAKLTPSLVDSEVHFLSLTPSSPPSASAASLLGLMLTAWCPSHLHGSLLFFIPMLTLQAHGASQVPQIWGT